MARSEHVFKILEWFKDPSLFYKDIFDEEPYPYQKKVLSLWNEPKKHKRVLILACSGSGKTKLLASIGLFFPIVLSKIENKPKHVVILSGSLSQARNVYQYIRGSIRRSRILSEMIEELRQSDTTFKDGSSIKALASSLTSIQGVHGDLVIVDEAALVEDFLLDDCYRIIGASDGVMIWSGTPTVYESKFVKVFEEESKNPKLWEIFSWNAWECPSLRSQIEEAKNRLPEDMWQIFWEGKPYPLTGVVIPRDSLAKAIKGLTRFKYDANLQTIIGIDWGFKDPTALTIWQLDQDTYYCLEAYSWKETDFDNIISFVEKKSKEYSVHRIHVDVSHKGENLRLIRSGLPVVEVSFGQEKSLLQSRLRDLFIKEKVRIPDDDMFQDLIYQLRTYHWTKKSGEDFVDSTMLALRETSYSTGGTTYIVHGKTRKYKKPIIPFSF